MPMQIAPRPPKQVMRLSAMGAFCQTRLSFMRALLRRLKKERWSFSRAQWNIDNIGRGVAVYRAARNRRAYSLVVFSHELNPQERSDRVIAEKWDATFALVDGEPSAAEIKAMAKQVPLQEKGRNSRRQIVLSRANRSARAFDGVVSALAAGRQPNKNETAAGYLMRTTAVYGNGKFGIADRDNIAMRPEFAGPFSAELLAVYLFRQFPPDLAEHLAAARSPSAVKMEPTIRRRLGIGNSTGLGMAPFIVNHPQLLHCWMSARETALARVRSLASANKKSRAMFMHCLQQAQKRAEDNGDDSKLQLRRDLKKLQAKCKLMPPRRPWNAIYLWGEKNLSDEGRETLVSLLLEPHGDLVDDLTAAMACDESFHLRGEQTVAELRELMREHCDWIERADFSAAEERARFWYVSENKQEPRLGERELQPGAELELPLAIMRDMQSLSAALSEEDGAIPLSLFLLRRPQHRRAARRAQMAAQFPYGEIRDNLIAADMLPLNMLRCKLSFFGATDFDPRSDRWLQINMFRNAPHPFELQNAPADEWAWQVNGA